MSASFKVEASPGSINCGLLVFILPSFLALIFLKTNLQLENRGIYKTDVAEANPSLVHTWTSAGTSNSFITISAGQRMFNVHNNSFCFMPPVTSNVLSFTICSFMADLNLSPVKEIAEASCGSKICLVAGCPPIRDPGPQSVHSPQRAGEQSGKPPPKRVSSPGGIFVCLFYKKSSSSHGILSGLSL